MDPGLELRPLDVQLKTFPSSSSGFYSSGSLEQNAPLAPPSCKRRRHSWPFPGEPIFVLSETSGTASESLNQNEDCLFRSFCGPDLGSESHQLGEVDEVTCSRSNIVDETVGTSPQDEKHSTLKPERNTYVTTFFVPPDGDRGWTVVLAAFFISWLTTGLLRCYGLLFSTKQARSGLLCYATANCVLFISVPMGEMVCRTLGAQRVAFLGTFLFTFSLLVAFLIEQTTARVLTLGIIPGFGICLCFVSMQAIISDYFWARRSLALLLASSGPTVGFMIWPALIQFGVQQVGFKWTCLAVTGIASCSILCASMYTPAFKYYKKIHIKHELPHKKGIEGTKDPEVTPRVSIFGSLREALFSVSHLPQPSFTFLVAGIALSNVGFLMAVFALPLLYSEAGYDSNQLCLLLVFFSTGDVFARICCCKLKSSSSPHWCLLSTMLSGAASMASSAASATFAPAAVLAFVMGIASGADSPWNARLYKQHFGKGKAKVANRAAAGLVHVLQGLVILVLVGFINYLVYNTQNKHANTMIVSGGVSLVGCGLSFASVLCYPKT